MRALRSERQAGFALVESIAVLALSGLVLLTLVIATDLVSRNSAAAAVSANTIETLTTGLAAARHDLEDSLFIRLGPKAEDPMLFSGAAQAVAVAVSDDGTHAGESLVLIEARYEKDRGVLVRSSAPLLPGTTGFGAVAFANQAVLLSGPWKYTFSYHDPQGGADHWLTQWVAGNRMPDAVRIAVLSDGGDALLPPLVVRLRINSGGCAEATRIDCTAVPDGNDPANDNGRSQDQIPDNSGNGNDPNSGL